MLDFRKRRRRISCGFQKGKGEESGGEWLWNWWPLSGMPGTPSDTLLLLSLFQNWKVKRRRMEVAQAEENAMEWVSGFLSGRRKALSLKEEEGAEGFVRVGALECNCRRWLGKAGCRRLAAIDRELAAVAMRSRPARGVA